MKNDKRKMKKCPPSEPVPQEQWPARQQKGKQLPNLKFLVQPLCVVWCFANCGVMIFP